MIAPHKQIFKAIKLLPQEKEGNCRFNGKFVATHNAIGKFGEAVIIGCHITLQKEVKRKGGLAHLQVFEIDSEKPWFVDDVSVVTCLLPKWN